MLAIVAVILGGFWAYRSMSAKVDVETAQATGTPAISSVVTSDEDVPATAPAAPEDTTAHTATEQGVGASLPPALMDVDKVMGIRAIGNKNAPIKIIEYASMTCSHCAHFHNDVLPVLKEKYIDAGSVYFEFREFPLNDPALKATITARCLPEDKYESFVSLLFKTQDQWAGGVDYMAALKQNSRLAGLSEEHFQACQDSASIKAKIAERMQEAQDKWKIESTPTFIINDGQEIIKGAMPVEEFERVFRKVSNNVIGGAPAVE
jgi:protein-disulfide isomerase